MIPIIQGLLSTRTLLSTLRVMLCALSALHFLTGCSRSAPESTVSAGHDIIIIATDQGFEYPSQISSGMSHIIFENQGESIHEVLFVMLPEDMTGRDYRQEVEKGMKFPENAVDYSGPGPTSPGRIVEIWTKLDPGSYLLVCRMGDHLGSLPLSPLTVHAMDSTTVEAPAPDLTLKMKDYGFELDGDLSSGPKVIRVENLGPSMHEVDIFRLYSAYSVDDLKKWHAEGRQGLPPGVIYGGVLDSHDLSRIVWLKTDFQPGRYVFWCTMPMVQNQPGPAGDITHADAGMFLEFVIEEKGS